MMFTVLMIHLDPPVFIIDLVSKTWSVNNRQLHLHTPFFKHCKDTGEKTFSLHLAINDFYPAIKKKL